MNIESDFAQHEELRALKEKLEEIKEWFWHHDCGCHGCKRLIKILDE